MSRTTWNEQFSWSVPDEEQRDYAEDDVRKALDSRLDQVAREVQEQFPGVIVVM